MNHNLAVGLPAVDPAVVGASLGALVLIFFFSLLVWLVICGFFIHIAAKITGIAKTFGYAVSAVLWQVLFAILLSIGFALMTMIFIPLAPAVPFLTHWLAMSLGIRQAYSADFLRSVLTAVLASIFSAMVAVGLVVLLVVLGLFSISEFKENIRKNLPAEKVEWRAAPKKIV
jgi:hypothetical protein